ncbi:hypothetical protein V1514DRAFT_350445 [Lipomyces japonicus]|uniref:uncharacterized protein n=1 Tax=Lipomyces japonicus TaxID=56871 RepID=UPI0034CE62AA
MASIDLSSNAREIQSAYDNIVLGDPNTSWAVFSYGAGINNQTLKLQATGSGDLDQFTDEFSDGRIQYGFARVIDPNSQLPKFVLVGWSGEGVPERAKGYFNSHFSSVARLFHGYHVQINARSEDDINPDEILRKVADASGSKYSVADLASKFNKAPPVRPNYTQSHATSRANESDWGDDAPEPTAHSITKVASAYTPHKIDLDSIRKSSSSHAPVEPVKSAYQPIGKVDIASIRASASKQEIEAEKPVIVKGAYQPIGKVDIAAIRAQAKREEEHRPAASKPSLEPTAVDAKPSQNDAKPPSFQERGNAFSSGGRLTELPKPKLEKPAVASRFGSTANNRFGTVAPAPSAAFGFGSRDVVNKPGSSKFGNNFGNENGKTPAQLWAERKARNAGGVADNSSSVSSSSSFHNAAPKAEDKFNVTGHPEEESNGVPDHASVSYIRDRFAKAAISNDEHDDDDNSPSLPERSASPIRLVNPISSSSTVIRPAAAAVVPPTREPEPEPEPEKEQEEEEPEQDIAAPAPPLPTATRPVPTAPEPQPEQASEPEPEPKPEPEPESEQDFQKGRAAAAAAISSGGIFGGARPSQEQEHDHEPSHATHGTEFTGQTATVLFEYIKQEDNEINLVEGERIYDIEFVDDGWWSGRNSVGDDGLFPSNYVELQADNGVDAAVAHGQEPSGAAADVAEPEPEPEQHAQEEEPPNGPSAIAQYDYEAQEDNELSFPEGAVIEDIQFPDEDWWSGVYNGVRNLFPANYVTLQ